MSWLSFGRLILNHLKFRGYAYVPLLVFFLLVIISPGGVAHPLPLKEYLIKKINPNDNPIRNMNPNLTLSLT